MQSSGERLTTMLKTFAILTSWSLPLFLNIDVLSIFDFFFLSFLFFFTLLLHRNADFLVQQSEISSFTCRRSMCRVSASTMNRLNKRMWLICLHFCLLLRRSFRLISTMRLLKSTGRHQGWVDQKPCKATQLGARFEFWKGNWILLYLRYLSYLCMILIQFNNANIQNIHITIPQTSQIDSLLVSASVRWAKHSIRLYI